ncbi:AraC family transcriptional regulator [Sphingobacterium bovistauri]|uniref:Helix-turn-helix domain-containing protein n=1 Tax=Sphingobacterium bovistauri TaxID=2781959 RepID=A0ABS7Z6F0_9SPHI|nr:AraC family transcriptional regulator [Sphingobacterium bovistauri]MCA5005162.1 helix-turn-helix domain-containing protein [Sphingobacterium bovistauri]
MPVSILRETTPLLEEDCFMVFVREKSNFDFPLHVHAEYELNFIEDAKGAQRIVGDSIEEIEDIELSLIANADLEHGWFIHNCTSPKIKEITIQFHADLLNSQILSKNQFISIKKLFEKAKYGVTFSKSTIKDIKSLLLDLPKEREGFYAVIKLFEILYKLSKSIDYRALSSRSFHNNLQDYDSRRINKIIQLLMENYRRDISLKEVGNLIGMTEVSVSRFLKQRTGRTFIDTLNDIRLGHASRMLVDTTHSIAEIALANGFNNLSNFNRIFLKKRGGTPSEFRNKFRDHKFYL